MFYYYPLSTRDFTFENIFSTESVSPPFFYQLRGFGINYFYVIPEVNHESSIILYSEPPSYNVDNDIKFLLKINEDAINVEDLTFLQEGVFAYHRTIYLEKDNFILNFFSEKHQKITLLKAINSLPTKSLDKYLDNFHIISENDCSNVKFNLHSIDISKTNAETYIKYDHKYNKFKGLIFGIACGLSLKKSEEELILKELLAELKNSFAEYKNRIVLSKFDLKEKLDKNLSAEQTVIIVNRIRHLLTTLEYKIKSFSSNIINIETLSEILYKNISKFESLEDVKQYLRYVQVDDEILGTKKLEKINNKYDIDTNQSTLEHLKKNITFFLDETINPRNDNFSFEQINDVIRISFHQLDKFFSSLFSKNDNPVDLSELKYDFQSNSVVIGNSFQNLNHDELVDILLINNVILKYSYEFVGSHRDENMLRLVKYVGDSISKNSKETLLYQYLNNKIDTYEFEKISNVVMKNFVAFIFNIESIEKLENFIDKKKIESEWIAYSFWGAFNGFANLSGNFTRPVFSKENEQTQIYIENYLREYSEVIKNLSAKRNPIILKDTALIDPNQGIEILISKFYEKYIEGNYKLSKDDLIPLLSIDNKELFYSTVKTKFKINKKNAEKLFNIIKNDFSRPLLFS